MSEYLSIEGRSCLRGTVRISGAKNAALPLLISTLLTREKCILKNVPNLEDISVILRMLRCFGAEVEYSGNTVVIKTHSVKSKEAPHGLVKSLRASFWVLGPLLARVGEAHVALPGGDAIGARPVDLHLRGLVKMGADVRYRHGVVVATAPGGLSPQEISLDFPSVGATHHLMMTAALVPGETILKGAAREPEVVALAQYITQMGAVVEGAGTSVIRILGRESLGGAETEVVGDRIEAATYLIAGAMTGGSVCVEGLQPGVLRATLEVLQSAGCCVECKGGSVTVSSSGCLGATSFSTAPCPGLATDVQPLLMAAMTSATGVSSITETVFDNRFGHVAEYRRFGAQIEVNGCVAEIRGVEKLHGAAVAGLDIRAAAGMVLMGLASSGFSKVYEIHHLDRGYQSLIEKFESLGAKILRSPVFDNREIVYGC